MKKLSEQESNLILDSLSKRLNVANIVIVYGDHVEGKMDTIMCTSPEVDALNFGENAIDTMRGLLRKIDRQGNQTSTTG